MREPSRLGLALAGVSEAVTVAGEAAVLDMSSARIGVNVSPEEMTSLPVNGRNFANLMTLATGATTDGNGGWASIRFNGKSNQQNYLNYDGVDGTYVWDASPGYLNATGSQFRLQTSMESIAEFRVNSGLAPAESGLGAGGNITVISKSGSNRFSGSVFEYLRNDALDSASKYDDKKQQLEFNQFGGSLGGPIVANRTFFFGSYEGLRQTTGLSFTEAVPSDEAIRRIMAGEPVGSGGGQSPERARRRWRPCSPVSRAARWRRRTRSSPWPRSTPRPSSSEDTALVPPRSPLHQQPVDLRAPALQRWPTSTRPTARSRRAASLATQNPMNFVAQPPVHLRHERGQRVEGRLQPAEVRRHRVRAEPATTRPRSRCPARSPRSRSTPAARPASRAAACWSARRATPRPTGRPTTRGRFRSATP